MSTTTLPGWEDEESEDWWSANPAHESEAVAPPVQPAHVPPQLELAF